MIFLLQTLSIIWHFTHLPLLLHNKTWKMKGNPIYWYLCTLLWITVACSETTGWTGIQWGRANEAVKIKTSELKDVSARDYLSEDEMMFDVSVDIDSMHTTNTTDSLACALINNHIVTKLLGQPSGMSVADAISMYIERKKNEFSTEEYLVTCYDHITGIASYGREGIINYTFKEDYYGGGAHPTQIVTIKRFNALSGTPIELWDVFADSCSNSLKSLLTDKLMELKGAGSMDDLREIGYLDMVDMFIPTNFWMDKDSLSFFFNQYDIAPYALGQTSLTFSYEELKRYMR